MGQWGLSCQPFRKGVPGCPHLLSSVDTRCQKLHGDWGPSYTESWGRPAWMECLSFLCTEWPHLIYFLNIRWVIPLCLKGFEAGISHMMAQKPSHHHAYEPQKDLVTSWTLIDLQLPSGFKLMPGFSVILYLQSRGLYLGTPFVNGYPPPKYKLC
jgi:hypothetical protein